MVLCAAYITCNYGNLNVKKAPGGYWKEEEDITEYATLYSPLSDYREWKNSFYFYASYHRKAHITVLMLPCLCILVLLLDNELK